MKEFQQLCKTVEDLPQGEKERFITSRLATVLPVLAGMFGDETNAAALLGDFILCSMAADNKLTAEEYALGYPFLRLMFGEETEGATYEDRIRALRADKKFLQKNVDDVCDLLGKLSEDLKADIILICLAVCAIDGKVSAPEKKWIRQLIRD